MARLPNIIVIAGPTASGKSAYAIKLAQKKHGEIVSADSRQVYKHLTIGSGKITKKEMQGVKHHCLDLAHPAKQFSVEQYKNKALSAIETILKKGKTPIIVGGTGFYIDSIVYENTVPNVPPNPKLRKKLEKYSTEKLFQLLKKLDTDRANKIDQHNPRRLMRAIEIASTLGKVPKLEKKERYNAKIILLNPKNLDTRISKRVDKMIQKGLIREVKKLISLKIPERRIQEFGFEYWYPYLFIKGKISKEEMSTQIKLKTRQYAKRQMTWFKKAFSVKVRE